MGTIIIYLNSRNEVREFFTPKTAWTEARKEFDLKVDYTAIIDHELVENDF